jgi:hypothetical protein
VPSYPLVVTAVVVVVVVVVVIVVVVVVVMVLSLKEEAVIALRHTCAAFVYGAVRTTAVVSMS